MANLARAIAVLSVCTVATTTPAGGQPAPATAVASPLEVRVTMDYRNRPASEVLQTLTRAAGLTVTIAAEIGRAHVLNSSHITISYAVFCLKKKNKAQDI